MTDDRYYARARIHVVSRLSVACERWFAAHPAHERALVAFELAPGAPRRRLVGKLVRRSRRADRAISRLARGMHDRFSFPANKTIVGPGRVVAFRY